MVDIKLDLTNEQKKKLRKGSAIVIKPSQMDKGLPFSVGKVKHNRMHSSIKKGKGMKLQLSPKEIKDNEKEGKGLFGDLAKMAVKKLAPIVKKKGEELLKSQGKKLAKKGMKKLSEAVGKKNKKAGDFIQKVSDDHIDKVVDIAVDKGSEKLEKKMTKKKKDSDSGDGWKEFWRGTRKIVRKSAPVLKKVAKKALPVAAQMVGGPLAGGVTSELVSGMGHKETHGEGFQEDIQIKGLNEKMNPHINGNFSNFLPRNSTIYRPSGGLNDRNMITMGVSDMKGSGLYSGKGLYAEGRGLYSSGASYYHPPIPRNVKFRSQGL